MSKQPKPRSSRKSAASGAAGGAAPAKKKAAAPKKKAPATPARATEPQAKRVKKLVEQPRELPALPALKKLRPPVPQTPVPLVIEAAPTLETPAFVPAPETAPLTEIAAEATAAAPVDRGAPIPSHYGMDRLVALVRDTEWLFVYWELQGGALDRLRFDLSAEVVNNARWVLRVLAAVPDAKLSGGPYFVDVDLRAGHWYLKVAPGRTLGVDMGFVNPQGEFVLVLKGNSVSLPRPTISDVVDEAWMIERGELEKLLRVTGSAGLGTATASPSSHVTQLRLDEPRAIAVFSGQR